MEMYIGENIKRLRHQKGITQEALAERMNVSAAAVSKWERGETLPDISMVIPLASYFDVSTDEILGLNAAKNEERIQEYLNEYRYLGAVGKAQERFDLMTKAYSEFPNDWRIIEEYMWHLQYDPNCSGPYGNEVHKDELYALCKRVLDECTLDKPRYTALSILGGLYVVDGQIDKAVETAKRLPNSWLTQEEELEHCYECGTDEWRAQLRENIWDITYTLHTKIRKAALWSGDHATRIECLKKGISMIELVFEDGDYGFIHCELSEAYILMANSYVLTDDLGAAFESYEKGFDHARMFDELPQIIKHTSLLVCGKSLDMLQTNTYTQENTVAIQMNYVLSNEVYEKVKDMPRMQEIIGKYKPFAGNKNDYK